MIYSLIPRHNGNLRTYQIDAKEQIFRAWDQYESVMLQMPTGTGKTYLFTSLIKDIVEYYKANKCEINILIVAHRIELLDQISKSLTKYGVPHGFIQGTREQHLWQRVQVGSIMSLLTSKNELSVRRCEFDFIIVDEAHHTLADTYKKLFEAFPDAKKLGVTATPYRLNHETFLHLYQYLITTPQVSWFINNGYLSDFDYVSIKPDSEIQKLVNSLEIARTGDFYNEELETVFDNQRIRARLLKSYKQFAEGRKGIVYAINKNHARHIAEMYRASGVSAVEIDCDTPSDERERLIEQFKDGKIMVLVNIIIFTEGFDCPDVEFIQLARPTRSLALYLQQVGRGLRISEGKEKTIILDNVGLYNYFGLPDANRKWQYHFKGREIEEEEKKPPRKRLPLEFLDEEVIEEDDEPMMVVRGAANNAEQASIHSSNKDRNFTLCDYYHVSGNENKFVVRTLTKKGGHVQGVSKSVVLEYDDSILKIILTSDPKRNRQVLATDSRIQALVLFSASLCGLDASDVLDVQKIGHSDELTLFRLLEVLAKYYNMNAMSKKSGKN